MTFQKSTRTIIENPALIPEEYKKTVVEEKINTDAIKAAIKAGKNVEGARIEERYNPQINSVRRAE